jgi:hypothetical protein
MKQPTPGISNNLRGKIIVNIVDHKVVFSQVRLQTKDYGWTIIKKKVTFKPNVVEEFLGVFEAVREDFSKTIRGEFN